VRRRRRLPEGRPYQVQFGRRLDQAIRRPVVLPDAGPCGWASIGELHPREIGAIVDEAHRLRKKVASHSMTPTGHKASLAAGADSIEHGDVLDEETVKAMVAKKSRTARRSPSSTSSAAPDPRRIRSGTSSGRPRRSRSEGPTRPASRSLSGPTRGASTGTSEIRPEEFSFMVRPRHDPLGGDPLRTTVAADLLGLVSGREARLPRPGLRGRPRRRRRRPAREREGARGRGRPSCRGKGRQDAALSGPKGTGPPGGGPVRFRIEKGATSSPSSRASASGLA